MYIYVCIEFVCIIYYMFNCMCAFSCCIKDIIAIQKMHGMGSFTVVCFVTF